MSPDEQTHVSGKSWVPAAFAWGALLLGIYLGREVTTAISAMEARFSDAFKVVEKDSTAMRSEMLNMRRDVTELVRVSNDAVSLDRFELWRARFELANPGLTIPEMPRR